MNGATLVQVHIQSTNLSTDSGIKGDKDFVHKVRLN